MLESISVKNLALIKESEVILRPGLNILTGETGAGKSIILGSIRLALGERVSRDIIRRGEDYALVELMFHDESKEIEDKLNELDIPIEPDGSILIKRKIMDGRSVCKCNGETISSKALRELASMLINIHGQNDTQTLLDVRNYRDILDDFGGEDIAQINSEMKEIFSGYKELEDELKNALSSETGKDKEVSLAEFEISEIEAARLEVGEDEELAERYRVMKNGSRITEALSRAFQAVDTDNGAGAMIGASIRELNGVLAFDEGLSQITDALLQAEDIIKDTSRRMQDYMDDMEFSEQEFREVESRLDTYNHLKNKYGDTVEKILSYADEKRRFVQKMQNFDEYLETLKHKVESAKREALECAERLTGARKETAVRLEKLLTDNLKELNFMDVNFNIEIKSDNDKLSSHGVDDIDFLVSFNMGEPVKSLSHVASGGELSRFMLALKAVTADKDSIGTLVFDEIDSGISGKTAWNVSEKMALLSRNHQVIAITHLPQIAAMADSHYLIEKKVVDESTVTDIYRINDSDRENELARLISGGELTDAAIINARELIANADKTKVQNI